MESYINVIEVDLYVIPLTLIIYNFEGHSDAYVQYLPTELGLNKSPFPFNLIKLTMDFVTVVIKITPKNVITKY